METARKPRAAPELGDLSIGAPRADLRVLSSPLQEFKSDRDAARPAVSRAAGADGGTGTGDPYHGILVRP